MVLYTQTLTPASVAANTTAEQTFTVTGLVLSSAAWVNKPSFTTGIGIVGVEAGEMLAEAMLAIEMSASARDLAMTMHAHPTLSETVA